MVIVYALIAVFISWIWVDYFRLIDVFEKEKFKYFALTFILGCASIVLVMVVNKFYVDEISLQLNGYFINDFFYCVINIGIIEELAKMLPFIIIYFLFKKQFNEPIDFLVFISISALGFAAAENLLYFMNHGPYVINGRAILSTVGHMFDTSLVAYGIIRYKYYPKKQSILIIPLFFFFAALSHGFYDFWLIFESTKTGGWVITVFYFMLTISFYAVILNNALNNSTFFTYKKVIDSYRIVVRLLTYYLIVFISQFAFLLFFENFQYAVMNFIGSLFVSGFIVIVSVVRLSRFKLIKNRWEKLKIELPFSFLNGDSLGVSAPLFSIRIKGDSYNEIFINNYYEEFFMLHPLSERNTYIGNERLAYIERKIFLKNLETFYLVKVFNNEESGPYQEFLIKPKTNQVTMVNKIYPIVAILKFEKIEDLGNSKLSAKEFDFLEWAYIKPKLS